MVVDPADYEQVIAGFERSKRGQNLKQNVSLAAKVFRHTAAYDSIIANYMTELSWARNT